MTTIHFLRKTRKPSQVIVTVSGEKDEESVGETLLPHQIIEIFTLSKDAETMIANKSFSKKIVAYRNS